MTPAQIGRISDVGERRRVRSGEVLFEFGEQNTRFFLVLEGRVEIVEGLAAGDQVVTAGQLKIRDGTPVSVVNAIGA